VQSLHQRFAADVTLKLGVKLIHQANRLQVLPQRKPPGCKQTAGVDQIQVTNTCMVVVQQVQAILVRPSLPLVCSTFAAQQAPVSHHQQAGDKMQMAVQVNLQRRRNVFLWVELI
jgi:hypothetical protein